jgi:hypothetical protein
MGSWFLGAPTRGGEGEKRARPAVSVETVTFGRQGWAFQGACLTRRRRSRLGKQLGLRATFSAKPNGVPQAHTSSFPTDARRRRRHDRGRQRRSFPPPASLSLPCSGAQARRRIVRRPLLAPLQRAGAETERPAALLPLQSPCLAPACRSATASAMPLPSMSERSTIRSSKTASLAIRIAR